MKPESIDIHSAVGQLEETKYGSLGFSQSIKHVLMKI
jgi:hypothetical protein